MKPNLWPWLLSIISSASIIVQANGQYANEVEGSTENLSVNFTGLYSPFAISKWLDSVQEDGYDKLVTPGMFNGSATEVKIEIFVESIGNFRSSSMDYEMDVFFIEHWTDHRLKHNESSFIIFSDKTQLDRLWTPDIYFANSKTAQLNFIMVPNMNVRVWPNGRIRLGTRISMKVLCHMNLWAYPIDRQECKLKILTCATAQYIVNVSWATDDPVSLDQDIQHTDLTVNNIRAEYCSAIYYGFSYSCLLIKFSLERSIQYSLLQTYFPTTFIVIISWISFWIDPASVPGRVGLALTTLLTLSTQAIAIQFQLPPVGYPKAQDVWFGICLTFLFASLVEFATVNMYMRWANQLLDIEENLQQNEKFNDPSIVTPLMPQKSMDQDVPNVKRSIVSMRDRQAAAKCQNYKAIAKRVDALSRILFPIAFVIVCTIYWSMYLGS